MISPSMMLTMGTMPPSGEKLSCMALTEPLEATVVASAQMALAEMPKRVSLPSMEPMAAGHAVEPVLGEQDRRPDRWRTATVLAAKIARPWLLSFTIRPNVNGMAAGIRRMASISRKLLNGVGFSNGWAELTPKNPPPLLPSCLMAICDAAGPMGMICSLPSRVDRVRVAGEALDDALGQQEHRKDDREREKDVERRAREVDPEIAQAGAVLVRELSAAARRRPVPDAPDEGKQQPPCRLRRSGSSARRDPTIWEK